MNSRISAIVPVYNVEQYLPSCVDSLLKQTVPFKEIILVDDGSRDSSGAICDDLEKKNQNIKVFHQENGGLSAARNKGISVATGDYLLFVDSDDTIDFNAIEKFEREMRDITPDLVVANLRVVWKGKDAIELLHTNVNANKVLAGRDYLYSELINYTMHMASVQCLYRRLFLIENELMFTKGLLHEDELFTPSVFLAAKTVLPTNIVFYNHMMREGSITTQKDKTGNAKSIIEICYRLESIFNCDENIELKEAMLEHCVDLYYKVYVDANLNHHPEIEINNQFLFKYGKHMKNRFRYFLYRINNNLFFLEEKYRRKL